MASLAVQAFFRQQDERMNISDDDMDEHYIARMTANNTGSLQKSSIGDLDAARSEALTSLRTRGSKRKSPHSAPLRSSPRIKRSKIATTSSPVVPAQLHRAEGANSKRYESTDKGTMSSGGEAKTFGAASESLGPSLKPEHTEIIADNNVATPSESRLKASTAFSASNSSSPPARPSSPDEDTSSVHITADITPQAGPSNEDAVPEEKWSSYAIVSRQIANLQTRPKKPMTLTTHATKLDPRPSTPNANESSIIDVFSSTPSTPREPSPVPVREEKSSRARKSTARTTRTAAPKPATKPTAKGKEKAKPVKMTFHDYVVTAQEKADAKAAEGVRSQKFPCFKGLCVFFFGADFTSKSIGDGNRKRINLLLDHGARVVPTLDNVSEITHIVVENDRIGESFFLTRVKLKTLDDIPEHVPIVRWEWAARTTSCKPYTEKGETEPRINMPEYIDFAAFSSRIPLLRSFYPDSSIKERGSKTKSSNTSGDFSHISEFSADEIQPNTSGSGSRTHAGPAISAPPPRRGPVAKAESSRVPLQFQPHPQISTSKAGKVLDPLAEYYEQARAELAIGGNEFDNSTDSDESDVDETDDESDSPPSGPKSKRTWLCKQPDQNAGPCPNQHIIDKLEELRELHQARPTEDDKWRVRGYGISIRALRNHDKRITSLKEARSLRGVGTKTAQKIMEIVKTGNLRRIAHERTEDTLVASVFTKIYGVGTVTAFNWYHSGCRTLEDLTSGKGGVKLSEGQKIGIQFYDDLNTRMPREEAKAIFEVIKPIALGLDPNLFIEIMGSYRRGRADCGDIDILITRCPDDGRTHKGVLRSLIKKLHRAGILTEDLALPDYSKPLEAVYHGLCRLPNVQGSRRRRIDFLTVPWSSKGGALLYYTGDGVFNCSMRLLANKMGYSLNQRGLYAGVVRGKYGVKLNEGTLVHSATEEEIFEVLGVPWREPHERVTDPKAKKGGEGEVVAA